jgi:hypothetical protein
MAVGLRAGICEHADRHIFRQPIEHCGDITYVLKHPDEYSNVIDIRPEVWKRSGVPPKMRTGLGCLRSGVQLALVGDGCEHTDH